MLKRSWSCEKENINLDRHHWIIEYGALTINEIEEIARHVWYSSEVEWFDG